MDRLPTELVDRIVDKFPVAQLCAFATLSAHCRRTASRPQYWRHVSESLCSQARADAFALWLTRRWRGSVKSLVLRYPSPVSADALYASLLLHGHGLRTLCLSLPPGHEVDLDWVSGGLRDLRDLSLSGAELMAGSDALKDMTALTSVCIDGGLAPNDADEWTITLAGLMCIPNLRELEINGLASPVALDHLDSGPAPPLESLRMTSECDLAVESLSPLTRLTALADLSLSMYSEAPDIPGLSSLTRLTALALDAACQTFSKPSTWHVEADTSELMDVVRILPRLAYLSCTDAPFQECTSSTIRHLQVSPISLARTLERGWDLDRLPNLERLTVSAMHDLRRLELGPVIAALSRPRRTVLTLELACRKMDVSHCSTQRWMDALARVDPIGRVSVAYTVSTAK